jgi:hypothetical protein
MKTENAPSSLPPDLQSGSRRRSTNPPRALFGFQARRLLSSYPRDWLVAAVIAGGGLIAYVSTLAPTVLDGDAALFEYTPSVLGVTYPTGYPTYILLGYLWQMLIPIGSVAYRMNLFSAVCGALALAVSYPALHRLLESRIAALCTIFIFATLPTYWRWATEAKIYTLHLLLLSAMLLLITRLDGRGEAPSGRTLVLLGLLFGLAAANHSTTVLLAPGLLLLLWLTVSLLPTPRVVSLFPPLRLTHLLRYLLPAAVAPLLLYLYVPLRAEWLLAHEGNLPGLAVPVAVARGLVSDFYHPGLNGMLRYFTAADFTHGVATNWGRVLSDLGSVYWPLMREDFTLWGLLLAAAGAVYFAAWKPRRFWPLFMMYAVLIPFVLTYGRGEQSAFLLPSSLMLAIFGGAAVAGVLRLIRALSARTARLAQAAWLPTAIRWALTLACVAVIAWLPVQQAIRNVGWLAQKWNDATYRYWTDVLAHPMEEGAGVLAHWGDLTSFWYLQHAEGLRPDLYGLYPPTEQVAAEWLAAGRGLYVAGPLQGWGDRLPQRYQLIPWGRLVRVVPRESDALMWLPRLPAAPSGIVFDNRLRLLKAGFDATAPSAGILPVTLAWQTIDTLPADVHISLRLVLEDGTPAAQADDTLLSGWLDAASLPPSQVLLSFHRFKLPAGLLPGAYRLQVGTYQRKSTSWLLSDGQAAFDLGHVSITAGDPNQPPDPWGEYKPMNRVVFGDEMRLVGYDYSVTRARQGRGFALRLLWQALRQPEADYTLLVELVDNSGTVWRDWRFAPAGGRAPTSTWRAGQVVRDEVDLVLPADAPPGEDTLHTRLAWLRPDGSRLAVLRWIVPAGDSVTLPGVRVVEQEDRVFEPPSFGHVVGANFDNQITLLGYDLPDTRVSPGQALPLTLVWQSQTSDIRASYTVFVHLVDHDGKIVAQADKEPGPREKRPTTSWVTGEVITDPVSIAIPPDAPPGACRLLVGLYLAADGSRLPVRHASGVQLGDSLELASVQVAESTKDTKAH